MLEPSLAKINLCFVIRENGKRKGSITGTSAIGLGLGWDVPKPPTVYRKCTDCLGNTVGLFQDHSKVDIIIK